ncbi:MAG: hypothetical protein Pg6C_07820 [Treponemataceae bacterium]|nr:MAG: hypothetical protein Pg6C_07820 [Treponemataceae bacterium]
MTVDDARKRAGKLFPHSSTPLLDAECILAYVLRLSRAEILSRGGNELDAGQESAFCRAAELRANGLPVAYITGVKEFFGFEFQVTSDVLIPKPDTELLVEKTLNAIAGLLPAMCRYPLRIADVCAGSGCVAVSLALCATVPLDITISADIGLGTGE